MAVAGLRGPADRFRAELFFRHVEQRAARKRGRERERMPDQARCPSTALRSSRSCRSRRRSRRAAESGGGRSRRRWRGRRRSSRPPETMPPPMPVPSVSSTKSAHALAGAEGVLAERRAARIVADEDRQFERARGSRRRARRLSNRSSASSGSCRSRGRCCRARRCRCRRSAFPWRRRALRRSTFSTPAKTASGEWSMMSRSCFALVVAGLVDDRRHHVRAAQIDTDCLPHVRFVGLRPRAGSIRRARERPAHARDDRSDRPPRTAQPPHDLRAKPGNRPPSNNSISNR